MILNADKEEIAAAVLQLRFSEIHGPGDAVTMGGAFSIVIIAVIEGKTALNTVGLGCPGKVDIVDVSVVGGIGIDAVFVVGCGAVSIVVIHLKVQYPAAHGRMEGGNWQSCRFFVPYGASVVVDLVEQRLTHAGLVGDVGSGKVFFCGGGGLANIMHGDFVCFVFAVAVDAVGSGDVEEELRFVAGRVGAGQLVPFNLNSDAFHQIVACTSALEVQGESGVHQEAASCSPGWKGWVLVEDVCPKGKGRG